MTDMKQGLVLAGTGHRPNRLGGYNRTTRGKLKVLANKVVETLLPRYGYCGGALGWDTAWGIALMEAKVPYCMALPCPSMGSKWYETDKNTLAFLVTNAHRVHYLSDHYFKGAFILRDRYMVDNAEGLVSLLDPSAIGSGTYQTCQYAETLNLPIIQLWHEFIAQ
ncbi:hypothetical protein [Microcoleus phage My-WqHQDG]|nr:hypothetical protein [Microcoleus phage My-WqHQDG]